jgi:hypothetical protein
VAWTLAHAESESSPEPKSVDHFSKWRLEAESRRAGAGTNSEILFSRHLRWLTRPGA